MLLGHLRPDAGEVSILGRPLKPGCEQLARVGAMVDGPAFYPWLTGRRNLEVALATRGWPRRERRSRAERAAERLGLRPALDRRYSGYSTGMSRRLGIAAAIAHDPELIILDEPTAGLDPVAAGSLRDLLAQFAREQGAAILLSSHLLGEVEILADRVVLLARGRVVRAGKLDELLADADEQVEVELEESCDQDAQARALAIVSAVEGVHDAKPGSTGGLTLRATRPGRAAVVNALVAAGLTPVTVAPRRRTLEEMFMEEARP